MNQVGAQYLVTVHDEIISGEPEDAIVAAGDVIADMLGDGVFGHVSVEPVSYSVV